MQAATKATTSATLINVVQCYCIAVYTINKQLHSRTSCSSFDYIKSQEASVSQWWSIHFPLCPHLKRLVHMIHLAILKES